MPAANSFLIGADPEFAILNGNNLVMVEHTLGHTGKLGWDHGGRVVEVRPDPKHLASQLCADIFRQLNRRELVPLRQYRWKAGGIAADQPVGGHIHFDIPNNGTHHGVQEAAERMTDWFEALELFPMGEVQLRRTQSSYGGRNDWRGAGRRPDGHQRLEYRTPPSWLYSPRLAHLTLSAFKLALVRPELTLDMLHDPDIRPVYKFRDFITNFESHDSDAAELAPLVRRRNGLEVFRGDPNDDIKTAWGIPATPSEAEPATVETQAHPTASPTAAAAISYYSQRLLEVAEANTTLMSSFRL